MQAFAIGSSADDPGFQGEEAQPVLELEGVAGSSLRLLLEPNQIAAAQRGLEMIWNLMASRANAEQPA